MNNKQIIFSNKQDIKYFYNNYLNNNIIDNEILLDSCSGYMSLKLKDIKIDFIEKITINKYNDIFQIFIMDNTKFNTTYKQIDPLKFIVNNNTNKLFEILNKLFL